jgi:hypothetical protein
VDGGRPEGADGRPVLIGAVPLVGGEVVARVLGVQCGHIGVSAHLGHYGSRSHGRRVRIGLGKANMGRAVFVPHGEVVADHVVGLRRELAHRAPQSLEVGHAQALVVDVLGSHHHIRHSHRQAEDLGCQLLALLGRQDLGVT